MGRGRKNNIESGVGGEKGKGKRGRETKLGKKKARETQKELGVPIDLKELEGLQGVSSDGLGEKKQIRTESGDAVVGESIKREDEIGDIAEENFVESAKKILDNLADIRERAESLGMTKAEEENLKGIEDRYEAISEKYVQDENITEEDIDTLKDALSKAEKFVLFVEKRIKGGSNKKIEVSEKRDQQTEMEKKIKAEISNFVDGKIKVIKGKLGISSLTPLEKYLLNSAIVFTHSIFKTLNKSSREQFAKKIELPKIIEEENKRIKEVFEAKRRGLEKITPDKKSGDDAISKNVIDGEKNENQAEWVDEIKNDITKLANEKIAKTQKHTITLKTVFGHPGFKYLKKNSIDDVLAFLEKENARIEEVLGAGQEEDDAENANKPSVNFTDEVSSEFKKRIQSESNLAALKDELFKYQAELKVIESGAEQTLMDVIGILQQRIEELEIDISEEDVEKEIKDVGAYLKEENELPNLRGYLELYKQNLETVEPTSNAGWMFFAVIKKIEERIKEIEKDKKELGGVSDDGLRINFDFIRKEVLVSKNLDLLETWLLATRNEIKVVRLRSEDMGEKTADDNRYLNDLVELEREIGEALDKLEHGEKMQEIENLRLLADGSEDVKELKEISEKLMSVWDKEQNQFSEVAISILKIVTNIDEKIELLKKGEKSDIKGSESVDGPGKHEVQIEQQEKGAWRQVKNLAKHLFFIFRGLVLKDKLPELNEGFLRDCLSKDVFYSLTPRQRAIFLYEFERDVLPDAMRLPFVRKGIKEEGLMFLKNYVRDKAEEFLNKNNI